MSDGLLSVSSPVTVVAESSPWRLLRRRWFWLSQRGFLAICLAGIIAVILLAPYTYQQTDEFAFLTVLIHGLALWGAFLTIRSIAELEVEVAILTVIETRASDLLRSLKAKQIASVELDSLEVRILPDNSTDPPPAMIRLFQHICKEAGDRKFESSVSVLEPYREEPLEELFKLQNLQKIALWLGILGTFIGLMIAIQVGRTDDIDVKVLPKMISEMFSGLYISFSASLAGLEVAVILGFFLLLLRSKQKSYFELMESSVTTMLSLARNALNRDDVIAEFGQVSTAMSQLTDSVSTQTTVISNRLDDLQKQIIRQNAQITQGLEKLMSTGKAFDGFLTKMTDGQRQFIDDVRAVYDAVALKKLGTTMQDTIGHAAKYLSETIKPNVLLVSDQLVEFNRSVTTLNGTLKTNTQEVSENLQKLESEVKRQSSNGVNSMQSIQKQLSAQMTQNLNAPPLTKSDAQEIYKSVLSLNHKLDVLNQSVDVLNRSDATRNDSLMEKFKRLLRKLTPSFLTERLRPRRDRG
jgi:hypothetical protein